MSYHIGTNEIPLSAQELGDSEQHKKLLSDIGLLLANAGYTVHWETQSQVPALVVNSRCLIRASTLVMGCVYGTFLGSRDDKLSQRLKKSLGDTIEFSPFPIPFGQPNLGDEIVPSSFAGKIIRYLSK